MVAVVVKTRSRRGLMQRVWVGQDSDRCATVDFRRFDLTQGMRWHAVVMLLND